MSKTHRCDPRDDRREDRRSTRAARAEADARNASADLYLELWAEALTLPRQYRASTERRMRAVWNVLPLVERSRVSA